MSRYEKILFDRAGTISTITFNRPASHNALDRQMSDELADAVRAVQKDRECRFLIFRGAGDTSKTSLPGPTTIRIGKPGSTRKPPR